MRPPTAAISTASPRVGAKLAFILICQIPCHLMATGSQAAALAVAVWAVVGVQGLLSCHRRHLALLCSDKAQASSSPAQLRPAICPRPGPHFYTVRTQAPAPAAAAPAPAPDQCPVVTGCLQSHCECGYYVVMFWLSVHLCKISRSSKARIA